MDTKHKHIQTCIYTPLIIHHLPTRTKQIKHQIATVNKLKQKLRNAIAADLSLAVPFLRIAINDGIGFDVAVRLCVWRVFGIQGGDL